METVKTKIPSKVEQGSEHLIIEVGCGAAPFLKDSSSEFKKYFINNPNILYFGLDLESFFVELADETVHDKLKDELGEEAARRFTFIEADGSDLPVNDEAVDELILSNVLGDPRIDRYQGEKQGEVKLKMLREAYRSLKPGGYLTILEDITPIIARRDYWIERAEEIFRVNAEFNEPVENKPIDLRWVPSFSGTREQISPFVARLQKKI